MALTAVAQDFQGACVHTRPQMAYKAMLMFTCARWTVLGQWVRCGGGGMRHTRIVELLHATDELLKIDGAAPVGVQNIEQRINLGVVCLDLELVAHLRARMHAAGGVEQQTPVSRGDGFAR